jgi:hypothetical protein
MCANFLDSHLKASTLPSELQQQFVVDDLD